MEAVRTLVHTQQSAGYSSMRRPSRPGLGYTGGTEETSMHVDQMGA